MRRILNLIGFVALTATVISCKKNNETCFQNDETVRQITNKAAIIKNTGGQFYIVEEGTIDTQLNPCNLTPDFKIDNRQVMVSGDVKKTIYENSAPCCTENFVITNIY